MSYQVLARKWRPRNFQEMVGQEHVLKALINALDNDRLHHAYMFTGTRGVGKTTIARILAKCLNCEEGVTSTPCGKCSACVSIDEGRFIDLIEVDAASRSKVDETRELMENVQYAPSIGRYKVYLIDEVHMFSNHSFNALLKTLEEPPPHVKFLLATTELKKVPITILSRCLQFNLKHIGISDIQKQLQHILAEEKIEFDDIATELIARAANGSVRDSLSLMDQAISFGGGKLEEDQVRNMLGTIDSVQIYELMQCLLNADGDALLDQLQHIAEHGTDYDLLVIEMLNILQQIAVVQAVPGRPKEFASELLELAESLDAETVQLYYQILLIGRRDLELAPDLKGGFEMLMIRLLSFQPGSSGSGGNPQGQEKSVQTKSVQATTDSSNLSSANTDAAAPKPAQREIKQAADTHADWSTMIQQMGLSGLLAQLASYCSIARRDEKSMTLTIPPDKENFLNPSQRERLITAIQKHYGEGLRINITVEESNIESPAEEKVRKASEDKAMAEHSIRTDPNVEAMQEMFGATIDPNSIQLEPNS